MKNTLLNFNFTKLRISWGYYYYYYYYYYILVFFHRHWWFTGQYAKGGNIFYSTLPLLPAHKHSDIYLELWMWDDYHIFLSAMLVFTRLLFDGIYHLVELLFDWLIDDVMFVCLFTWCFDSSFLLQQFQKGNQWIWTCINYHSCITAMAKWLSCWIPNPGVPC